MKKKPKGALIAGIIFLVLSLGGCVTAGVGLISFTASIVDAITNASATPLGETTTFEAPGDSAYVVATVSGSLDCIGTDSAGNTVTFTEPTDSFTTTIEVNGEQYDVGQQFDTVEDERYEITCDGATELTGVGGQFAVVPVPSLAGGIIAGVAGFLGGGLFFIIGVILLIVGLVQRSKWKKAHGGGGGLPAMSGAAPGAVAPPPPGGAAAGGFTPGGPGAVPPPPAAAPPPPSAAPPPPNPGAVPPPPPGPAAPPPPPPPSQG